MNFYHRPRRLLLDAQIGGAPPSNGSRSHSEYNRAANFDTNMVIILAALLCALICALGINSIIRCILRCATRLNRGGGMEETLDSRRFGRKGLKKAALRQIPVAVYGSDQGVGFTECPICLGEFSDGEKIRVLPKCHHCFHVKCVDTWLACHSSCPTCRQSLAEEQAECVGGVVAEGGGRQLVNVSGGNGGDAASAEEVG
ncbi:hypothetical protein ACS0TY_001130 [Phlomoides rotata]